MLFRYSFSFYVSMTVCFGSICMCICICICFVLFCLRESPVSNGVDREG